MRPEHRGSPRRRVLKSGKVIFNHNASVVDCTIRNLSSVGALLLVPSTLGIPAHVELLIDGDTERVACDVAWRHAQQLGVRFAPRVPRLAAGR